MQRTGNTDGFFRQKKGGKDKKRVCGVCHRLSDFYLFTQAVM